MPNFGFIAQLTQSRQKLLILNLEPIEPFGQDTSSNEIVAVYNKSEIKCCKRTSASYFLIFLIILNIFFLTFFEYYMETLQKCKQQDDSYYFLTKIPDQNKTKDSQFCYFETCFGDLFRISSGKTLSPIFYLQLQFHLVRQPKNHEISFPRLWHFIDHNRLGWACFDSSRIHTQAQWAQVPN